MSNPLQLFTVTTLIVFEEENNFVKLLIPVISVH